MKEVPVFRCVVDSQPIPYERAIRGYITCSAECSQSRRKGLIALQDNFHCRFCNRPSTTLQRVAFKNFVNFFRHYPRVCYPQQYDAFIKDGGTQEGFVEAFFSDEDGTLIPSNMQTKAARQVFEDNKELVAEVEVN